jgi:rRNA pseudouridine-1189 N-methylase Emg1 (Nep1/Mra1 family)
LYFIDCRSFIYIQPTDVLLFSGNINSKAPNTAGDIVDIILQLLKEGKITKQQIDASYKRIIRMKNERKNL